MKKLLFLAIVALSMIACNKQQTDDNPFVHVVDGHFIRDGKPYYYVGTNLSVWVSTTCASLWVPMVSVA